MFQVMHFIHLHVLTRMYPWAKMCALHVVLNKPGGQFTIKWPIPKEQADVTPALWNVGQSGRNALNFYCMYGTCPVACYHIHVAWLPLLLCVSSFSAIKKVKQKIKGKFQIKSRGMEYCKNVTIGHNHELQLCIR